MQLADITPIDWSLEPAATAISCMAPISNRLFLVSNVLVVLLSIMSVHIKDFSSVTQFLLSDNEYMVKLYDYVHSSTVTDLEQNFRLNNEYDSKNSKSLLVINVIVFVRGYCCTLVLDWCPDVTNMTFKGHSSSSPMSPFDRTCRPMSSY